VPLHTIASPDHPLIGRPITVDELRDRSTLLGQEERCSFWMATRTWLGQGTDLIKVGGIPQVKQWVAEGRGVAVLPDFAVTQELQTGRLAVLDLDTPPLTLRLVWRAARAAEQPLRELLYALSQT
jgi:DNA-binding transcriptional LysR family regulator